MDPILVTGAGGGSQGSTGFHLTRLLLERGEAVRAFVHTDDARADRLRALGAEVVVGDLCEITSVLPAVRGIRRAYFTYPVTAGFMEATGAFAAAARQEGVERVVEVSQLAADPWAGTPRMRLHWVSEQVFDWAGVGAIHLRAAVFFENMARLVELRGGAELYAPLGMPDTVVPLIAGSDVVRVAAGLLVGDRAVADPVIRLTGEILTVEEIVRTLGGVRYVDADPEEWHRWALSAYRDPHTAEHLTKLWEIFRTVGSYHELYEVTPAIEDLGGAPPQVLKDFV